MNILLTGQISNSIPDPDKLFYPMCDDSSFGIGAAILQLHKNTNKMNLIPACSRLFTQAKLTLSTFMRECTAKIYTLKIHSNFKHNSRPGQIILHSVRGLKLWNWRSNLQFLKDTNKTNLTSASWRDFTQAEFTLSTFMHRHNI